ncbi:MAG: hypothetical protein JW891_16700 [Candidatus Lokiarchaeota archaeon]|nr:hypothetical protein [Candidatus Lokiarchaeota archaeon]
MNNNKKVKNKLSIPLTGSGLPDSTKELLFLKTLIIDDCPITSADGIKKIPPNLEHLSISVEAFLPFMNRSLQFRINTVLSILGRINKIYVNGFKRATLPSDFTTYLITLSKFLTDYGVKMSLIR